MSASLEPETEKNLIKLLKEVTMLAELDALALFTKEGIKVAFASVKEVDPDLLSAISAAVLSTGATAVQSMGMGDLWEVYVRGKTGYLVLSDAGDHVLFGAGTEATNLGLSIRVLRSYAKKIISVLD